MGVCHAIMMGSVGVYEGGDDDGDFSFPLIHSNLFREICQDGHGMVVFFLYLYIPTTRLTPYSFFSNFIYH